MAGQGVALPPLLRVLLADLLDDAARVLRRGTDDDAQRLALHLVEVDGPHRSAWLKMAPLCCRAQDRPAVRGLVKGLIHAD